MPTIPRELGKPSPRTGWYKVTDLAADSLITTVWFDFDERMNAWYWSPYGEADFECWMCCNNACVRRGRLVGVSPKGTLMALIGYLYRNNPTPPGRQPVSAHNLIRAHRIRVQLQAQVRAGETRRKAMLARELARGKAARDLARKVSRPDRPLDSARSSTPWSDSDNWDSARDRSSSVSDVCSAVSSAVSGSFGAQTRRDSFVHALSGLGFEVAVSNPHPSLTLADIDTVVLRGVSYTNVEEQEVAPLSPAATQQSRSLAAISTPRVSSPLASPANLGSRGSTGMSTTDYEEVYSYYSDYDEAG